MGSLRSGDARCASSPALDTYRRDVEKAGWREGWQARSRDVDMYRRSVLWRAREVGGRRRTPCSRDVDTYHRGVRRVVGELWKGKEEVWNRRGSRPARQLPIRTVETSRAPEKPLREHACEVLGHARSKRPVNIRRRAQRQHARLPLASSRFVASKPALAAREKDGTGKERRRRTCSAQCNSNTLGRTAPSGYVASRHDACGTFDVDGRIESPGRQLSFHTVGASNRSLETGGERGGWCRRGTCAVLRHVHEWGLTTSREPTRPVSKCPVDAIVMTARGDGAQPQGTQVHGKLHSSTAPLASRRYKSSGFRRNEEFDGEGRRVCDGLPRWSSICCVRVDGSLASSRSMPLEHGGEILGT